MIVALGIYFRNAHKLCAFLLDATDYKDKLQIDNYGNRIAKTELEVGNKLRMKCWLIGLRRLGPSDPHIPDTKLFKKNNKRISQPKSLTETIY